MGNDNSEERITVKPFLKWAGGKSQLISQIEERFPPEIDKKKGKIVIKRYVEPFVGGGALFFYLMSAYDVKKSYISDTNEDLIVAYKAIKHNPKRLIEKLMELKSDYDDLSHEERKPIYEDVRHNFNDLKGNLNYSKYSVEDYCQQAANLIFLNKTCFNGIFRVNSKGFFNVPMGRYKNPSIFDEENILNISKKLKNTTIKNASYEESYDFINSDSLVYLDPPYRPITKTSFTSYTKSNFDEEDHIRLAEFAVLINSEKHAKVILSNSDSDIKDESDTFFKDHYPGFKKEKVLAKRFINSDGNNRGPIHEVLLWKYD